MDVVAKLSEVLETRKGAAPDSSYVASLYAAGLNKILEKVGEESTEVVLASRDLAGGPPSDGKPDGTTDGTTVEATATNPSRESLEDALVCEVADLWFHSMVMLTHQNVAPAKVLDELARRFGVSGIEEKQRR